MVGASAGAAIGGLHTTTDGLTITPLFWLMLFLGTALAVMLGKKLFPPIAAAMTLTCITEKEKQTPTPEMLKTIRTAKLALAGLLAIFCALDFFGWWRYANEANAAHAHQRGAFIIPPVPAGFVMMFISALFILAKFSAVYTQGQKHREKILDELELVQHQNNEITRKHDEEVHDYNKAKAAYDQHFLDIKEAGKNAAYRTQNPAHGIGELAQDIQAYRLGMADLIRRQTSDTSLARLQEIQQDVESQTRIPREEYLKAESDVDRVYTLADAIPR
jgi:hypothetical protein